MSSFTLELDIPTCKTSALGGYLARLTYQDASLKNMPPNSFVETAALATHQLIDPWRIEWYP